MQKYNSSVEWHFVHHGQRASSEENGFQYKGVQKEKVKLLIYLF